MASLFFKDNHAANDVTYKTASAEDARLVTRLLQSSYRSIFKEIPEVCIIEGSNINSGNFRLGGYYLKTLAPKAGIEAIHEFPVIARSLSGAGIPVTDFIPNDEGELISNREGFYYYLSTFIEAGFYPGTTAAFGETLPMIAKLKTAVKQHTPKQSQMEPYFSFDPITTFAAVKSKAAQDNSDAFRAIEPVLMDSKRPAQKELHHIDLHPHNLLFQGNQLKALLDLESFRAIPYEMAAGFALFKLGRKAISRGELTIEQFKRKVESYFDLNSLYPFVKLELARRILLVLKLHHLDSDCRWDADLTKHLCGLEETKLMFT
jgi:hypothetical protein